MFSIWIFEWFLRLSRCLWTVRVVRRPDEKAGPFLYAHWHGDELLLVPTFADEGYAVMSSRSKDGEKMAGLLQRLGYQVVRGSSSRGGAGGLKGLLDAVRSGQSACFAVDGPRGPVHQVKPGIVSLAQWTGLPVYPIGVFATRKWFIPRAWNQGYYPKPFSRAVIWFGNPLRFPAEASEKEKAAFRERLRESLLDARKAAEEYAHLKRRFTLLEQRQSPIG
ncbi:DUF374 domain-containing protein [bacterium]|nr:DUF374 domain-containing protein [bacterium]